MSSTDGMANEAPQPEPMPTAPQAEPRAPAEPFPWKRLVFALLFAVIGWFTFWIALALGVLQFIFVGFERKPNEDLKRLNKNLSQYLRDLIAYITFARDEKPFPFAPFPDAQD